MATAMAALEGSEARMKLLALDTGTATGVATWTPETDIWSAEMKREDAEDFAANYIPKVDLVITEQLVISQQTIRKGREVQQAIEMVGLVRTLCRWHGIELYDKSKPGEVMRFATDEKLKRIGWYVAGKDHQRDARRHILTWLADHRLIDLSTLLPKED